MKTIHHVCDINTRPEVVWAALTRQDRLASWWSTRVAAPPLTPGAVIHFTFYGDFNPDMQITEVTVGKTLGWKCVGGHSNWSDSTFKFELEATDPEHTRLRFWQFYAVELADDYYGVYNFNWAYYLESLSKYCETGTGTPFVAPS